MTAPEEEEEERQTEEEEIEQELTMASIIKQTLFISALLIALLIIGVVFFKEPIDQLAKWVVDTFGMTGLLIGVVLSDTLTMPIPPDVMLFTAAASPDIPNVPMIILVSLVSTAAGSVAYFIGPHLRRIGFVRKRIEAFRPRGEALFEKWGVWAVAIGALSPLPYSIICWFAGIYKMPYKRFFFATLFRIPRMVGYYIIFMFGWQLG